MLVAGPGLIRFPHFTDVLMPEQRNAHEVLIGKKFRRG